MPCKKRDIDGCTPWMKRNGLYTNGGGVERETIHME